MADRTELRRLAEAARDDPSSLVKAAAYLYALDDPATTIALLDAAERADRAEAAYSILYNALGRIELLLSNPDMGGQNPRKAAYISRAARDEARAFLAEVNRAE